MALAATRDESTRRSRSFVRALLQVYGEDRLNERSAALAYHMLLALVPLLIFIVVVGGFVFGIDIVLDQALRSIEYAAGPQVAELLRDLFISIQHTGTNLVASFVGAAIVLFGATNVFNQLRSAFFEIFSLQLQEESVIRRTIKKRTLAFIYMLFLLVLAALLIMLNIVASAIVQAGGTLFAVTIPSAFLSVMSILFSLMLLWLLFTIIYRSVSAATITWRQALIGGAFTAVCFVLANMLFSFIIAYSATLTAYGPVGTVVIFILWVYYLMQVLLLGAEVAKLSGLLVPEALAHAAEEYA